MLFMSSCKLATKVATIDFGNMILVCVLKERFDFETAFGQGGGNLSINSLQKTNRENWFSPSQECHLEW